MKKINVLILVLLVLALPLSSLAVSAPLLGTIPPSVDANTFTVEVYTDPGSKVTIVGGPSEIAPVQDGAGDDQLDGTVEITVPLLQNQVNYFSVVAEAGGQSSDSVSFSILEESAVVTDGSDLTPPDAPTLNPIPDMVDAPEYIITGFTEANANIYARRVDGTTVGTTQADGDGFFQVWVPLIEETTNRINVSAEDEAGNEGFASQAVIRMSWPLPEGGDEVVVEEKLSTSAQIFFQDIEGHWAESYIEQLYLENVVTGKSEGIFEPDSFITRAEITKIAVLAYGHSVNATVNEHPFQDVPMNSWFAPYVEEGVRLGFIEGYPTGGFWPHEYVNRAEALKIILGAAELTPDASLPDFDDVPLDAWYTDYVAYSKAHDIVSGYGDGTFGPGNHMTRAEVAKVVINVLELKQTINP